MNELTYRIAREYLRGLRLTGSLEKLGFDITDYHPNLFEPMLELLGLTDTDDRIADIIDKYEEQIIDMSFYDFMESGLDRLTKEMLEEIKGER